MIGNRWTDRIPPGPGNEFHFLTALPTAERDDTAVRMPSSPGWNGACTAPTLVHSTDLYIRNGREKGLTYSFCLQNPFTVKKKI